MSLTHPRRFSTSNCPTTELAWTNFELRREIEREVQINLENEAKIKRLERQLVRYEDEIVHLNNLVGGFQSRENDNKKELSRLRLALNKSNSICETKEKYILYQDSQLLESQETIIKLKGRINTMAQSSSSTTRPRRIQPPSAREYNTVFDSLTDDCRDVDDYIQGRPEAQNMTNASVVRKITNITDKAKRLCDIGEWSERELTRHSQNTQTINQLNNQVAQLQNQLQQNLQAFAQIQNTLNDANNNFNLLNQAHILQGQQLQNSQINAQLWRVKYQKWKNKAKTLSSIIWFVNTPN
jgi:polyhydroxyalkanoate synthesis regulator phasin